jgi:hypothetical protein
MHPDRRLDLSKLLTVFQQHFCQASDAWMARRSYREAGVQLLTQTFLRRIIKGRRCIEREYALGTRRADLCVRWRVDRNEEFHGPVQKGPIELKVLCDHDALDAYARHGPRAAVVLCRQLGADQSYLAVFDLRRSKIWEERIWQRTGTHAGRVIGM